MKKAILLIVLWGVTVVHAQESCVALQQAALSETGIWCQDAPVSALCAGNSQVLYGNTSVVTELETGKTIPLADLKTIQTLTDANNLAWGVAEWQTRAYSARTWDTELVTMLAFGDVLLVNNAQSHFLQTLTVVSPQGANIRSGAGEDFRVLQSVMQGETVKAIAHLADDSWIQVLLRDGSVGWVVGSAFNDDLNALYVTTADSPLTIDAFLPFSNLTLTMNDNFVCDGGVPSGLLIQTEAVEYPLGFVVNGVNITIFGTSFVQSLSSPNGDVLHVYNLRGEVTLEALGTLQVLNTGQYATVLLDGRATAVDTPHEPLPYKYSYLSALPVQLLPETFYVPLPDVYQYARPKPKGDISPISSMLATEPCRLTTGDGGSNIRAGAGLEYPVLGTLGFRESVGVQGRTLGSDGQNWWNIAPYLWISAQTTVTGGDCIGVPVVDNPPLR